MRAIEIATIVATTIRVTEQTRRKLEKLKDQRRARSLDELLAQIADRELAMPKSLFGKVKGLRKNFAREDEET